MSSKYSKYPIHPLTKKPLNPDETGDFENISYEYLVFRFIGRQKRLQEMKDMKHTPSQIIESEENLIQKAYNQMRDKCYQDPRFMAIWGGTIKEQDSWMEKYTKT